jgi:hypothetical protein
MNVSRLINVALGTVFAGSAGGLVGICLVTDFSVPSPATSKPFHEYLATMSEADRLTYVGRHMCGGEHNVISTLPPECKPLPYRP